MSQVPQIEKTIKKEKDQLQKKKQRKTFIINGNEYQEETDTEDESSTTGADQLNLLQTNDRGAIEEESKKDETVVVENRLQVEKQSLECRIKNLADTNDFFFDTIKSWSFDVAIRKTGLPPCSQFLGEFLTGKLTGLPFRANVRHCFIKFYSLKNNKQKNTPMVTYLDGLLLAINALSASQSYITTWQGLIRCGLNIQKSIKELANLSEEKMVEQIKENGRIRFAFGKSFAKVYDVPKLNFNYSGVTFFFNPGYVSCSYQFDFPQYDKDLKPSNQYRSILHKQLDNPKQVKPDLLLTTYMKIYEGLDDAIRPFISGETARKNLDALLLMSICNSHLDLKFDLSPEKE